MAIMFAGGMAIGVPSFMPGASSDFSVTDGMLTVSSEFIQGGAILEIVVNDPNYSNTLADIGDGPVVSIGGDDHDLVQASNGKWYAYVVDESTAEDLDNDSTGFEYGVQCDDGIGVGGSADVVADLTSLGTNIYVEAQSTGIVSDADAGSCHDLHNATEGSDDVSGSTARSLMTAAVLESPPSLSDHDDASTDLGQRGHQLNASGYGSWPYIYSMELTSDNIIEYGDDMVNVEFGNTDDETSIEIINSNPANNHQVHVVFTDPGLNIDPTSADVWEFDLSGTAGAPGVHFSNNGTNTVLTSTNLASLGCDENCLLSSDITSQIVAPSTVVMTESGVNTGVFESFDLNGNSEIVTIAGAAADTATVFSYGGDSVDMIITFNDATISLDNGGGDWLPTQAATVTIVDPDMNRNPGTDETLEIGDETAIIPTIKMGSPLTLSTGTNEELNAGDANDNNGVVVGGPAGGNDVTLQVNNTTDDSERLRITHSAIDDGTANETTIWINVTTGHTRSTLVNLPGTVVLNYDVSGPAALLTATDLNVYVTDGAGSNNTNNKQAIIKAVDAGLVTAGTVDLQSETRGSNGYQAYLVSPDVTAAHANFNHTDTAGTSLVTVNFEFTVSSSAAASGFDATADYAIAADFCNFDQNNGSLVHNCIYRIEAEETDDNTGIFEGTVEYVNLVNSTSSSAAGSHAGNDHEVESLITANSDEVTVVVQDASDGTDAVRVVYNDTDTVGSIGGTQIGAQLDTLTHTGTVDLDMDEYEAEDMATFTVVDPDLNQDSDIRDVYTNSSTTFVITTTGSDGIARTDWAAAGISTLTMIETTSDSGIFQGTFIVPDKNGQDIEITYYEAKNAGGTSVEYYDIATVTSNSGSIALDRPVYPVPFGSGDLQTGDSSSTLSESGNVTVTVAVTDSDFTTDTLTTRTDTGPGTVTIMLVQGTTTSTVMTAGSQAAFDLTASSGTVQELGPLSEVVRDSGVYEVEFTLDEVQHSSNGMRTIIAGDVLQVRYNDTADDSGSNMTTYDSSTFDLRTGQLSVDKDVYVLGSDMVITLTDPDLNLDTGSIEAYDMDIIEWDSDADSSELMDDNVGSGTSGTNFLNNPSKIEETGDDTGVFQTVVTLPEVGIINDATSGGTVQTIDFGETVTLTYVDEGLAGEDKVGDDELDVEAYFSISNFGALVELDQAVYTWTDVVYITITAPDHNTNSASEETVGTTALPIQATTRAGKMCTSTSGSTTYVAAETGPDTGVFTAEIQLTGYTLTTAHNNPQATANANTCSATDDMGGDMQTAGQTDGISVSYEYNDGSVVVASASVSFNIAEAGFDTSSASAGGSAVFSVVDPDENTDDDVINTFQAEVFSDSDSGGFKLTMNETDEDSGVFEGTVFFTSDLATSGTSLRVSEGDTVTAEYEDKTLPEPYSDDDDLTIAGTLTIGTAYPPLERAPAANARVVDAFGASVAEVSVDQQVQIAADVSNGQDKDQAFAYLVQVQDGNGVTVSLAWITGSLTAGQSMSPALSWTPDASGSYTATVFVWESVDNPTALSPTVSVDIDVV